jgi:hypothetical protein
MGYFEMNLQDHSQRISRRNIGEEAIAILRAGFLIGTVVWNHKSRNFDAASLESKSFTDGFRTIENAIAWIKEQS